MDKVLRVAQEESKAREAVAEVMRGELVETGFRTVALVRAKLDTYKKVTAKFDDFIVKQMEQLEGGSYNEKPFHLVNLARLVATWLVETGRFLDENESLLTETERRTRRGFVEESLSDFPEDIRRVLIQKFIEKKKEVLDWLAKEIQKANIAAKEREGGFSNG